MHCDADFFFLVPPRILKSHGIAMDNLQPFKIQLKILFYFVNAIFQPIFAIILFHVSCQVIHKPNSIFGITASPIKHQPSTGCQKNLWLAHFFHTLIAFLPKWIKKKFFFFICDFGLPQKIWQQWQEIPHKY